MYLRMLIVLALCALLSGATQAEPVAASSDSLSEQLTAMVERYQKKADKRGNGDIRIIKKMIAGTVSGVGFGAIAGTFIAITHNSSNDDWGYDRNDLIGAGYLLFGMLAGSAVGFPLGVTAVDPYDSWPITLLAGFIPGWVGMSWIWVSTGTSGSFYMALVGPVIGSLYASEKWRKPPQARRVSFGLFPTLNGGLSAVAQLRF